jgi:hypothetical protein
MGRTASRLAGVAAGAAALAALAGTWGVAGAGATPAASLPTVTVTATGTTISVGGSLVSGGVNVVTTTSGEAEAAPAFFALKPGATAAAVTAALATKRVANTPDYLNPLGAIVFDAAAPRGVSQVQVVLAPGSYVAVDAAGDNPLKWPTTTFSVSASPSPAVLDAPAATISAIDFAFRGPTTLRRGSVVRVSNDGFLDHMFLAFPVRSARTAKQLEAALRAGRDTAAQKLVAGNPIGLSAGPLSAGAFQQGVLSARAGYYVLACFMDTQDGREHTRLGMERTIRIVG